MEEGTVSLEKRLLSGALLGTCIMLSLASLYWSLSSLSLVVVVPILMVTESVLPLITGWIFFNEHRSLNVIESVGLACSILATVLIALSS